MAKTQGENGGKKIRKEKQSKVVGIVAAVAILILSGLAIYYFASRDKVVQSAAARQKAADFYADFIYQINTNDNWVGFVDEYTVGKAKEDMSGAAVELMDSAKNGGQYLVRFMSPIEAKVYETNGNRVTVLIDFDLGERIVGDAERLTVVKKYLTMEKIEGDWYVSEIFDRSDRFDESISE